MLAVPPVERLLVISPHLDDAVFSCGRWLAAHPGSIVVTVFAGIPAAGVGATPWDQRSGFADGRQAMLQRRAEDECALGILGARPVWLGFLDSQYGASPGVEEIRSSLQRELDRARPDTVALPLGLFHSDHRLAHAAGVALLGSGGAAAATPHWLGYEDALYRRIPGLLQQRLAELASASFTATPVLPDRCGSRNYKRCAVRAYASQLRAFGPGGFQDTESTEGLWWLQPATVSASLESKG